MEDNTKSDISLRLRYLLALNKETQLDMSTRTGASRAVISQWISGERTPSLPMIKAICSAYTVSANWLLGLAPLESVKAEDVAKKPKPGPVDAFKILMDYIVELEGRVSRLEEANAELYNRTGGGVDL